MARYHAVANSETATSNVSGKRVGVRVYGNPSDKNGQDVFTVYATGGSNGKCADKVIAVVTECGVITPDETQLARAVLEWAKSQCSHAGNPYCLDFVKMARQILGE